MLNVVGALLLFGAAAVWGTSFLILKNTIETLPPLYVLGIRFLCSAIIIGLIFIKKTIKITKGVFCRGAIIGLVVFSAYLTQTYGLKLTTPGQNAFITSLYCVMTPFFMWFIYKVKPKSYNLVAAAMCVAGIGLIAFSGADDIGGNVFLGNLLTFAGAIFYALQVIFTDRFSKRADDPMQLLTVNLFTIGALFCVCSAAIEIPVYGIESFKLNGSQILNIAYLTLACTLFAQFAQFIGQKLTTASQSAVILSLEGVFGTLFSVLMGAEKLTAAMGAGFAIIFIATLISELKPDFSKILKLNKIKENKDMTYEINNGVLKVAVNSLGAEITSVIKDGKERVWKNDNGQWDGSAPVLFPVCGRCKITTNGITLPETMHGVAWTSEFTLKEKTENTLLFTLKSSDETKKFYPYDFILDVGYKLIGDSIEITYAVKNPTNEKIYYCCGAHDSFALQGELEEYVVEFEKDENLINLSNNHDGYLTGETENFGTGRILDFGKNPLVGDFTFVFKGINSRSVILKRKNGEKIAEVKFEGFNNLLFWRPGDGKTVCIEPWHNIPCTAGEEIIEFSEKYGVHMLDAGESATYIREVKYF